MTRKQEITEKLRELLYGTPKGIRYTPLIKLLVEALPHIPPNTIHGTIWNIEVKHPQEFYKPAKGVFRLLKFKQPEVSEVAPNPPVPPSSKVKEEDFYVGFAEY